MPTLPILCPKNSAKAVAQYLNPLLLGVTGVRRACRPVVVVCGLSLATTLSLPVYAVTNDAQTSDNGTSSGNSNDNGGENNTEQMNDAQLEQALTALKLKQAVDRGDIDPSVLEDYRRETLQNDDLEGNSNDAIEAVNDEGLETVDSEQANDTDFSPVDDMPFDDVFDAFGSNDSNGEGKFNDSDFNNSDLNNTESNNPVTSNPSANPSQPVPTRPVSPQPLIAEVLSPEQIEQELAQAQAEFGNEQYSPLSANNDDEGTSIPTPIPSVNTPTDTQSINANLNNNASLYNDFNNSNLPVARLGDTTPPIGLDDDLVNVSVPVSDLPSVSQARQEIADSTLAQDEFTPNELAKNRTNKPSTVQDVQIPPTDDYLANNEVANDDLARDYIDYSINPTDTAKTQANTINNSQQESTLNTTDQPTSTLANYETLNPDDYLPEYTASDSQTDSTNPADPDSNNEQTDTVQARGDSDEGFFRRLYNRVFNDGYAGFANLDADVYVQDASQTDDNGQPVLVKADTDVQPYQNIKASIEDITVEAISDFTVALPKLSGEAQDASEAVGYFDTKFSFVKRDDRTVDVIVEEVGEPVLVTSRIVDVRGEGETLPEFASIEDIAPPRVGDVFNQGTFKSTIANVEAQKQRFGFYEGAWLDRSTDIILPDNTADVSLIYDTGERYEFGEVVYFTLDRDSKTLTTDPDKLSLYPELLHRIYDFSSGDPFYRPAITSFTNDLASSRYFNVINVEVVEPDVSVLNVSESDPQAGNATLEFDDNDGGKATQSDDLSADMDNADSADDSLQADTLPDDIEPIDFTIDAETAEKLDAVKDKANRLSSLPDDRVLDETEEEATNLLGQISDGISDVAEKILPDDPIPFADSDELPEDFTPPELEDKQTPADVAVSKQVPVYVFVDSDRPRDAQFGVGWGTDTGVRAVARLDHNRINRAGYQAGVTVGASDINKFLSLNVSKPWTEQSHPLDDRLAGTLTYEEEKINQGDGNLDLSTRTLKAGIARNIRQDDVTYNDIRQGYDFTNGWNQTYSLRYRLDELESGVEPENREDLPVPFNRADSKFEQQALLFGYAVDKTISDNIISPTRGFNQYYSIEAGAEGVATDTNMAIVRAGANAVYSFGEANKHQLVGSVDAGYIWADNFDDVPYKLRFFAGGDRSLRGYDYQSLSTLENGYLIGGEVLALGSAEYNYAFRPTLRGAVFADVGNAYDTNFETDTKLGVGFGVRWASPVGMVRLDLGAGVLEDSIPVRLYFYIGSPLQ